jgi:tRNA (guanine37-N1)-methyltransferase
MRFHVITIFPEMFGSYLNESILARAIKNKHISVKFYNPRDFIKAPKNNYRPVDDKPYGGGPGMVMRAEPLVKAIDKVISKLDKKKTLIINFIPTAEKFTTTSAKKISKSYTDVVLICGRYEGIDARIDKIFKTKKFSIGDFVVTGGELPAMVLIDSISRQIKGVLGKYESLEEERVSSSEVYTRPEVLKYKGKNYRVPKVLLSGNHKKIEEWKNQSKK